MKHKKTLQISIVVVAVLLVIWLIWGEYHGGCDTLHLGEQSAAQCL